ncbi:MAG: histidinol-phosphatase HisJ family protein [Eubacteriaceae bacterium]|nr:histidinol-phosphatase HisJ family protein [Eubacteriaceae bacterium]
MFKASYHNHSLYSDGKNTIREMIEEAVRTGFSDFAITDHAYHLQGTGWALEFGAYEPYFAELASLKEEYSGAINFIAGIEAEWFYGKGTEETRLEYVREHVEFTVGSVHYAIGLDGERYIIDGTPEEFLVGLGQGFDGDLRALVGNYYDSYVEMALNLNADLIAHPDIILKNAHGLFASTENWHLDHMQRAVKAIKQAAKPTEVNMGGNYRYKNGVIYPCEAILEMIMAENVPLTVGLDAHSVDMVNSYYEESLGYLYSRGVRSLVKYSENGDWIDTDIAEWMA